LSHWARIDKARLFGNRSGKSGKRECRVQEYRVFVIGPDGHVIDRIDLVCATEEDAIERARQVMDSHAVELWRGSRRIERFEPEQ
jgi:hypothetical protein